MQRFARAIGFVLDLVLPRADTARLVSEARAESFGALLSPAQLPDGRVALLPYRSPLVRAAVIETKFRRNERATTLLAGALRDYLDGYREEGGALPRIVPVPLGAARRKARGYNQVELVARTAGVRPEALLLRVRETEAQTSLSRQKRLRNMADAFAIVGPLDPNDTYIVLDDVTTTGATLGAAAEALRKAGAARVELLALAH